MAAAPAGKKDISGLIDKIKEQTASQNISASVQAERSTKIEKAIDKVDTKSHACDILKMI